MTENFEIEKKRRYGNAEMVYYFLACTGIFYHLEDLNGINITMRTSFTSKAANPQKKLVIRKPEDYIPKLFSWKYQKKLPYVRGEGATGLDF